jgi:predicted dehydrogenase
MIRWLVVGTGLAGRCHLAAIDRVPGADLAGVVTLEQPPPGIGPAYQDLRQALAETSPDAVILATPHDTHVPLALAVIEHGLPLLCEKPAGRNANDAQHILGAAAQAGVSVGVVLNQRAARHHRWIHELIAGGELSPCSISFNGTLGRLTGWHGDALQAGGGVLRSIGLHYLDLLRWWLGEPDTLWATTGGGNAEDVASVTMEFSNGAMGTLQLTAVGKHSVGPINCVIEARAARVILSGHVIASLEGLPAPPPAEAPDSAFMFGPGHLGVIADATAALLAGRPLPISLTDALPSLALVDRAYACARPAAPTPTNG